MPLHHTRSTTRYSTPIGRSIGLCFVSLRLSLPPRNGEDDGMNRISRRSVLLAAAALPALAGADVPEPAAPVLDAHIHVWDLKALNPPWLAKAGDVLNRRYMGQEYREATAGTGVRRAVYVEIAEAPEKRAAEARFVLDLIAGGSTPIVAAVIAGDPAAEGFADYVTEFAKSPAIKGLRCAYRRDAERDEKYLAGVRLLGKLGLSLDVALGAEGLAGVARLAAACPDTRIVLDHCGYGNPDWYDGQRKENPARKTWEAGIAALAEQKNVACKISGVAEQSRGKVSAERLAGIVNACLGRFGDERVLWGSNWPVCLRAITLRAWLDAVRTIIRGRDKSLERKLMHDNAERWYRLGA